MHFLAWFFGILLIVVGCILGWLAVMGAAMADRQTTWWENTGTPLLFFGVPTLLGIIVILARNW